MQVIVRVTPFGSRPADRLLRILDVGLGLIDGRRPSGYIRLRAMDVRFRNGYAADQSRDSSALVRICPSSVAWSEMTFSSAYRYGLSSISNRRSPFLTNWLSRTFRRASGPSTWGAIPI